MAEKSRTLVLPRSAAECYEIVNKIANERGFKEKKCNEEGIIWTAQKYTLETWITPISENKTKVEIIASSNALFDFGTLEKDVQIFAVQLKNIEEKINEPAAKTETDDVAEIDDDGTELESVEEEPSISEDTEVLQAKILKENRSWGISLLVLGVISILASSFLSAAWGVMLIMVGLASFYFRSSAMFVIYGVTLAWAGIHNLMGGQGGWMVFAFIQWVLAFRVFQGFFRFRKAEATSNEENFGASGLTPKRSAKIFPWASGILGAFSVLGFINIILGAIFLVIITGDKAVPRFLVFGESLIVNLGILAFAAGLASVLCKYPRKPVAILGMVAGVLPLLTELILKFR